ncbi:MAG: response regulator, partial [Candidatus Methanosuratincola petrocarbonis]
MVVKRVAFEMKRVLFADDSSLMRKLVFQTLKEGGFDVILASDGKEAVEKALIERPDAAVLDIRMPKMDGISALREIVPLGIPVVMFSSLTREDSQVTMDALEAGAFDFVLKPGGFVTLDISEVKGELLSKVKAAIVSKRVPLIRRVGVISKEKYVGTTPAKAALLVAASTGGPSFVKDLVQSLDVGGRYAVLIVQHMPPVFTKFFAERISTASRIPVREASNGEPVLEGV